MNFDLVGGWRLSVPRTALLLLGAGIAGTLLAPALIMGLDFLAGKMQLERFSVETEGFLHK